jgi:hypothetical protein
VPAQNFGEIFFSMCTKWYLLTFWPHGPHTSQHFSLDPHNLFASKQKNKNKKSKTSLLKTKESVFIGIFLLRSKVTNYSFVGAENISRAHSMKVTRWIS